jgi:protein phosphatase 1 regulatory subunit 11
MAGRPQYTQTAPTASTGTVTQTQTQTTPATSSTSSSATLVLRAEPAQQRHIQWADDVVDNEGMGKKSSKGTRQVHRLSPKNLRDGSRRCVL